jgi:hypothetical protein
MSITKLNNLSVSALTALPSGVGGKVLQVVTSFKSDTASTSSTSYVDTGVTVNITPSSASNKVLILTDAKFGHSTGNLRFIALFKNGSIISTGDTSGARPKTGIVLTDGNGNEKIEAFCTTFLDSPATTSATTYKVQGFVQSGQLTVNGNGANSNNTFVMTSISTITVMEIAV